MDEAAYGLRPRTEVHKPFLIPHCIEGHGSHCRDRPRNIRATERAKAVLRLRTDIGIAGIQWRTDAREHQESREIRLIEHIDMGKGREIAPITPVANL